MTDAQPPTPRSRRIYVLWAVALGVLVAGGYLGFRCAFYGSPRLVENKVLDKPVRLVAFVPPNIVEVESGHRYELDRVVFLFEERKTDVRQLFRGFPPGHDSRPVVVEPVSPGERSTRFNLRYENWYWCGNTFFPKWFPEDLPSYEKADLAATLVLAGHAKPAVDLFGDASNYAVLLHRNHALADRRKAQEAKSRERE